jgi:hypothetical protein
VVARVDLVQPRPHHGDRAPARFERAAVRGRVNAAREPRNDRHAARGQIAREHGRGVLPVGRAASRADHRHARLIQTLLPRALHVERDGRVENLSQQCGVNAVVQEQYVRAHLAHALDLRGRAVEEFARDDALNRFGLKAHRLKPGARGAEDGLGRAETLQELSGHARADARRHVQCYPLTHSDVGFWILDFGLAYPPELNLGFES